MSAEPRSRHKVENNSFSETNEIPYDMTDNLFETLQKEKMSAVSGKNLANLTINTSKNMRNNDYFLFFFEKANKTASKINRIEYMILPRKRKRPNYSMVNHVEG